MNEINKRINFMRSLKEWYASRLEDSSIYEITMGQSPPSSTYNNDRSGLPFLQGKMEFTEIYPSPTVYCSIPIKIAEKNDILISVRAPVGDVNISPSKLCIGRRLASIRCNPNKVFYLFLFYYLKLNSKKFESISSGSTFKAIRKNELDKFEVLLPPFKEQRKIAGILSTVDKAIEKVDGAIEKTERIKKGLIQELLTKGIGHQEFRHTEIGTIPKEWEVFRIREIGKLQYGYTTSTQKQNTGIKFLRISDINDDSKIDWEKVPYCEVDESNFIKYSLDIGDVLFARIGATTGKTAYVDRKVNGIFASYLIRLKSLFKNLHTKFFYFFTQSNIYWLQVNRYKEGQLKKGLNAKVLGSLVFPFPPLQEQQKIAEILSTVDTKLALLIRRKEKLQRIKKGLMNDLLTGKKRVKLDS